MSSVKGPVPKGVGHKKSSVVKQLPADLRESLSLAQSTSSLLPIVQPFHGAPSSIFMTSEEKKGALEERGNPVIHPDQPLLKKNKKVESSKQPMVAAPVMSTQLRLVERTMNMKERDRSDALDVDVEVDLDVINPIFGKYREKQDEIESNNPYQLENEVYTPITRRSFYKFIDDSYSKAFKIPPKPSGPIDENACQKIEESKRQGLVEAFSYQKFISEYLRQASPFRGLLVYHGLGSGKTCSAIAAAEALYGTANKKIIVMTPFSLRPNFISEISFCGFKHFNVNNHWVRQPIITEYESNPVQLYAREILSLSDTFIKGVTRRPEVERRVIWLPDFEKPSNFYDDSQITSQERIDIQQQITNSIENRIHFISYNGITASKLKEHACTVDEDGNRFFDNAVIVVDEIHNLIRLMQGNIVPYVTKRPGRSRKISVEPIVPGRWNPTLCDRPLNYKRAYLFYRLLTDARNSKIIGLSGTPIINFPEELGILSNVLAGYMECVKFIVNITDADTLEEIRFICEQEPRVDIVRYEKSDRKAEFLVSVFHEGYIRQETADKAGESYVGVQFTDEEEGQETIQDVYARIKEEMVGEGLDVVSEQFVSYPRLPVDDETFRREFINPVDLSIRNRLVLQKRITGLISYYAANNEAFMPRITKDELVRCEMSDFVLNKYTQVRKGEIASEANKKKETGDVFGAVEMFAKMKNPSSYRFRSRALCNFVFPESIVRPFPGTQAEEEEAELEIGVAELAEIIESASADPLNDANAMEEVMREEEEIEEPEEPVVEPDMDEKEEKASAPAPVSAPLPSKQEGGAKTAAQLLKEMREKKAAMAMAEEKEEKVEKVDKVDIEPVDVPAPLPSIPADPVAPADPPSIPAVPATAATADAPKLKKKPMTRAQLDAFLAKQGTAPAAPPVPAPAVPAPAAPAVPAPAAPADVPADAPKLKKKPMTRAQLDAFIAKQGAPAPAPAVAPAVAPAPAAPPAPAAAPAAPPAPPAPPADAPKSKKPMTRAQLDAFLSKKGVPVVKPVEEAVVEAEPVVEPEPEAYIPGRRIIPYKEMIYTAMETLNKNRDKYLMLDAMNEEGRLSTYSTKLDRMVRNILQSNGSNLVYSQFKTVEGLGVLGVALKANGFTEIVIQGSDNDPYFSDETIESLRKGPGSGEKRFILFTGEGSKDRRGLILNVFNGNIPKLPPKIQSVLEKSGYTDKKNIHGAICWVIGITGAGAEGISLKCCRSVHIMESYWNNVRLDQVKGRAIRICSHTDLPYAERNVDIYTYCTVFSEEQKRSKMDITLKVSDNNETSDERVYIVSIKKDKINQAILDVMKEAAVDCGLNSADVGDVQCLRIDGRPDQYLFDPDLEVDKRITGIQFKKVTQKKSAVAIGKSSAPVKPSRVQKIKVDMIRYDGKRYLMLPYPTDKQRFKLYSPLDGLLRDSVGEGELNPITKRPSRITLY